MPTVLVVDDARVDQRLAGSLLERRVHVEVAYAEDGRAAVEYLQESRPDLVVTDLQMPRMDGLELVEHVRRTLPNVPVILMTAHGSEEVAAEALRRGAASYVPKRNLSRDLARTVEQVLALVGLERFQHEALQCLSEVTTHFMLRNDPAEIHPVIRYVRQDIERMHLFDETSLMRICVALDEALTNAMVHGNLAIDPTLREGAGNDYPELLRVRRETAPYSDRHVHLFTRLQQDAATFIVRDDGEGFDHTALPDPLNPAAIERSVGRGLLLIQTFMDEIRFNKRGNELTMTKRRDAQSPPLPDPGADNNAAAADLPSAVTADRHLSQ